MQAQACVGTATLFGIDALPVEVEVDVAPGIPGFTVVGLGDVAVQEARERVRSALRSSGFEMPNARIVVNLAPGPLRKHGTGFDLPIAIGLLIATRQVKPEPFDGVRCVGELGLDGRVRPVPGMLAHAVACRDAGATLLGPTDSPGMCAVDRLDYRGIGRLCELRVGLPGARSEVSASRQACPEAVDFSEVAGQQLAIEALVVAAAGGHNILLTGPPGSGKTMLARRLAGILPPLSRQERMETGLVHSVACIDPQDVLAGRRPFRAPHHSASTAGLVGGGVPLRPGEVSLAHNGVLFLDEMPEFGPAALQCLRQPLEDGAVTLVRAEGRVRFPSRFLLVGAANPCPCGFLGDADRACRCPPSVVERYTARVGGPLMDRIDLVVEVRRPSPDVLLRAHDARTSEELLARVMCARERSAARDGATPSALSGSHLLEACAMEADERRFVEKVARVKHLSARGVTRLLRVARTVADLAESSRVRVEDLSVASGFRQEPGA